MKKILVSLISICCLQLQLVSAQSAEVQQLLLNVEKLAQFKSILSDMKKGYDVVFKGYNTIKDISEGNFNLHRTFLDGLMKVNPEIAKYGRVADIISYQRNLIKEYSRAYSRFSGSGKFSPRELEYLSGVYKNLLDQSIDNLDELTMVITASKLRMSDDERLEAIDRLHLDMQGKLVVLRNLNKRAGTLESLRERALNEQKILKKFYGNEKD